MAGQRIVVVEDERLIATSIAARLRSEGFDVHIATSGPDGVELCRRVRPDLVILDVMLPGFDGLEACRRIQAERRVPVLMLTARDSESDVVIGLGIGADDYVTKPFSPRELVARVRTILRRTHAAERHGGDAAFVVGGVRIDPAAREVTVDGTVARLTRSEFDLLEHLARSPGVVFSRAQLLVDVWGHAEPAGERAVDSHVAALRRKLGAGVIRTVHGVGYAAAAEEQA